jgi:hypothetical protein
MQSVFAVLIFCVILFFYLHIYFHMKTSNDLEVYEIDQPSKDKLEEVCDLRQPVLFDYPNERLMESCTLNAIRSAYGAFDVRLRNVKDAAEDADATEPYVLLTLHAAAETFRSDKESRYVSENNGDFLEETGLIKTFKYNDAFLRPPMVSKCIYDVMCASPGTVTPLRYDINYRNYYLVTQGSVKMRLVAPHASKYLYPVSDYDNFEFRSQVNPWHVQAEYRADFDKIKTMDVELRAGQIIYIPAYWWCSIQFPEAPSAAAATICCFKYRTYMNTISVLDKLCMWLLQQQNVKRDTIEKKITASTLSRRSDTDVVESTAVVAGSVVAGSVVAGSGSVVAGGDVENVGRNASSQS